MIDFRVETRRQAAADLIGLGVVTAAGLVVASAILAIAYWANTRPSVANTSQAAA